MPEKSINSVEEVAKALKLPIREPKKYSKTDVYVTVQPEQLLDVVKKLKAEYNVYHLSTIPAFEAEDGIHIYYPFSLVLSDNLWGKLILDVNLAKDNLEVDSITPEIPGAILYEREVYDLLGVKFTNHPDLRRLLTPDIMPADMFPLRKELTFTDIRERLAEEAKKRSSE